MAHEEDLHSCHVLRYTILLILCADGWLNQSFTLLNRYQIVKSSVIFPLCFLSRTLRPLTDKDSFVVRARLAARCRGLRGRNDIVLMSSSFACPFPSSRWDISYACRALIKVELHLTDDQNSLSRF